MAGRAAQDDGRRTTLSDDGNTITGRWEIAEDGISYATDFDLVYRKVETC